MLCCTQRSVLQTTQGRIANDLCLPHSSQRSSRACDRLCGKAVPDMSSQVPVLLTLLAFTRHPMCTPGPWVPSYISDKVLDLRCCAYSQQAGTGAGGAIRATARSHPVAVSSAPSCTWPRQPGHPLAGKAVQHVHSLPYPQHVLNPTWQSCAARAQPG